MQPVHKQKCINNSVGIMYFMIFPDRQQFIQSIQNFCAAVAQM